MKKQFWIVVDFILLLLTVVIVGILVDRHLEKNVNSFEFPTTVNVIDYTGYKRADTVAMIILNKIYEYDTINLHIFPMKKEMKNDKIEIAGFIQITGVPHSYQVFLKKNASKLHVMKFLSHELIHLDQMERGDLETFIGNYEYNVFNDDTIRFKETPYKDRLFEVEAFAEENKVYRKLIKHLYH